MSTHMVAVGDIQPNREEPESLVSDVQSRLSSADITYCQLECTLSNRGEMRSDVRNPAHRVPPKNVRALTAANFDIVSFAGNNNLDYGYEAFSDTIDLLRSNGIEVVGGGNNLEEATRPVVLERNGLRVAFVNFCSILRDGFAATDKRPGISPLSVSTFYEPLENIYEQPGTPARTVTIPNQDQLTRVVDKIHEARGQADVVIACFHWGVHFTHDLATYQPDVGYAAIDAGADVVLGTHPHCLQAIDVYRGKPIFYSLGNFAFEQPGSVAREGVSEYLSFYGIPPDQEVDRHPHPAHCRRTVLVDLGLDKDGVSSVSFTPAMFNKAAKVELLTPEQAEYREIVDLMQGLSAPLGTKLAEEDGSVRVEITEDTQVDTRLWVRRRGMSYPSLQYLATKG